MFSIFLIFLLSIGLSIPGLGLQSLTFISSIKKEVNKDIPKGSIVINGKYLDSEIIGDFATGSSKEPATIRTLLNYSYVNDCLSTLTPTEFNNQSIKDKYIEYADTNFKNNLIKVEKMSNGNIDMNDFSMQLFNFDMSIAKSNGINTGTTNNGMVETGISWIFLHDGLPQLFDNNSFVSKQANEYSQKTTQIKYDEYVSEIQQGNYYKPTSTYSTQNSTSIYTKTYDLSKSMEISSVPNIASIVANKVWFLNEQLRSLISLQYAVNHGLVNGAPMNSDNSNPENNVLLGYNNTEINNTIDKLGSASLKMYPNNNNSINTELGGATPLMTVTLKSPVILSNIKQPNYKLWFNITLISTVLLFIISPIILIVNTTSVLWILLANKNSKNQKQNKSKKISSKILVNSTN